MGALVGSEAIAAARGALGLTGGAAEVGAATAAETGLTKHGVIRVGERAISSADVQEAISTAKEAGNVTTKMGKYGTLQNVYRGSNGTTVIVETAGRNAGKVITLYRH